MNKNKIAVIAVLVLFVLTSGVIAINLIPGLAQPSVKKISKKEATDIDLNDWKYLYVNKKNKLTVEPNFTKAIVEKTNTVGIDSRIENPLLEFSTAAMRAQIDVVYVHGYKSNDQLQTMYDELIQSYKDGGMSDKKATAKADVSGYKPEISEYPSGLAIDIVASDIYSKMDGKLDASTGNSSKTQKWLIDNSYKYGFIVRYPEGKKDKTGIDYSPFHFRYVGKKVAQYIKEQNLTFDEYISQVKKEQK